MNPDAIGLAIIGLTIGIWTLFATVGKFGATSYAAVFIISVILIRLFAWSFSWLWVIAISVVALGISMVVVWFSEENQPTPRPRQRSRQRLYFFNPRQGKLTEIKFPNQEED